MNSTKLINFLVSLTIGWVIIFLFHRYGALPYLEPNTTTFIATTQQDVFGPLNREIDFIEKNNQTEAVLTPIETTWGSLLFSTDGAALERLDIKRQHHGKAKFIRTISPLESFVQQSKSFLLLLESNTPLAYYLTKQIDEDNTYTLIYQSSVGDVEVQKRFFIDKSNPIITLQVEIRDHKKDTIWQPRIMVRGPFLGRVVEEETISSIVMNNKGSFAKKMIEKIDTDQGWVKPQLFGLDDRYFVHALIKDNGLLQKAYYTVFSPKQHGIFLQAAPQKGSFVWDTTFFVGPKDLDIVRRVDARLEQTVDYAGWFEHIAKALLFILKLLFTYLHNYGFAIIALTILLKLLMLPLTLTSNATMKQQKELQKKLAYIQQKYKDNPTMLAQERGELIRKHGAQAIGLGGCLPVLVQIPIFVALSRLLNSSFELYQAPMLWIPDLSTRDPWYILPLVIMFSMLASALNADDKQKLSIIAVALLFGAFTANFAAGLALYIAVNALFGVLQTNISNYFARK
ncbi:MAG TPA: YidC/Oxa1 family insertase periplasmic-domain containing protein [Patescibacteria group bacterium]|nr:YidC/Oxa1 family insertase periplasmic-domain containing protein [Patescibacteria group bacterium]